jgi:hypothetical protein
MEIVRWRLDGGYLSGEVGLQPKMAGETRTALTGLGVVAPVASAGFAVAHAFGFADVDRADHPGTTHLGTRHPHSAEKYTH